MAADLTPEDEKNIKLLMHRFDVQLSFDAAKRLYFDSGRKVERAAQRYQQRDMIQAKLQGDLYDSSFDRELSQDQAAAESRQLGGDAPVVPQYSCYVANECGECAGHITMDFGRTGSSEKLVVKAQLTHELEVKVTEVPGADGKVHTNIECSWLVRSGLVVTDVVLCPWDSPLGYYEVQHKYIDGESSKQGSVCFENVARGLYDVRIFNNGQPSKPLVTCNEPKVVGCKVNLEVTIHDGNGIRIDLSTITPDGKKVEIPVASSDWIGLYDASVKDNKSYITYEYCSKVSDGSLEMRLPREEKDYQVRYVDYSSPTGVCCGVSSVFHYKPVDEMIPLSYEAATGILRIKWCCYSRDPESYNISVYTDGSKDSAVCQVWDWCSAGTVSPSGEHGILCLTFPKTLADTVASRDPRNWSLQDIELRFSNSRFSSFLFTRRVPDIPNEPKTGR